MIKGTNCVVLTGKFLFENKLHYTPDRLTGKLSELFEVDKVILIPWDKSETFGHADGMIRFIDQDHVLINGYFDEYSRKFRNGFFGALEKHNLSFTELNFSVPNPDEKLNWGYINFLQMENLLLVPQFGIEEDEQALDQIGKVYPEYASKQQIVTIEARDLIAGGGVLNCISWNIFQ